MRRNLALMVGLSVFAACSGEPGGGADGGPGGDPNLPFDLELVSLTAPATAASGDVLDVGYTLRNRGPVASFGYGVELRLGVDGMDRAGSSYVGADASMSGLEPGETVTGTIRFTLREALPAGAYRLWAATGPDRDASNDVVDAALQVNGPPCVPDAYEEDDDRGAARPATLGEWREGNFCRDLHDWFSFEAQAGVEYAFLVEGRAHFDLYDAAGETLETSGFGSGTPGRWTAPGSDRYFVDLRIDGVSQLGAASAYRVLVDRWAPDLVVDTVNRYGLSSGVTAGHPVVLSVHLASRAADPTEPFEVALRFTADAVVTGADPLWTQRTVQPAEVGERFELRLVYPSDLTPGTWRLAAVVDAGGAIRELDEDNNVLLSEPFEVVAPECTPDGREEDDWPELALPIAVGQSASGNLCDDAADWLSMDLAEGDAMVFDFRADIFKELDVFDADGETRLATAEYTRLPWTAPAAGTYLLRVSANEPQTGDWALEVQPILPDLEGDGLWSESGGVRGGLVEISASVDNDGHADAPESTVGVYLSPDAVLDASDRRLAAFRVPPLAKGQSADVRALAPIPLDAPLGPAYLGASFDPDDLLAEVHEDDNAVPLLQALTLSDPPCAPDAYEPDDQPAQGAPIAVGEVQSRNQCDDGMDWLSLQATADTTYVVELTNTDFFVSEAIAAFEEDGATPIEGLAADEIHGRAAFTASRDGRYLLRVGDDPGPYFGSSDTGRYDVTVATCAADAFEPDDDPAAAAPIAPGQAQARSFCDDEIDWATFDAVAGTTYVLETSGLEAGVDTFLRLEDAAGGFVTSNDDYRNNNPASRIEWTAPDSAPYRVKVVAYGRWGAASGYTLSLSAL